MEFCPYCQRWVEPHKGDTDILIGVGLGGPVGALIGIGNYLLKGWRCPICNRVIAGVGATAYIPPEAQVYPQPPALPRKPCIRCGAMISEFARYCNQCGTDQVPRIAPTVEKTVSMADSIAAVERLYNLKEKGAITLDEFEKLKSTLLGTVPRVQEVARSRTSQSAGQTESSESIHESVDRPRLDTHSMVSHVMVTEMGTPKLVKPELEEGAPQQTIRQRAQMSAVSSEQSVFCSSCGRRVRAGEYCNLCGEPLVENLAPY